MSFSDPIADMLTRIRNANIKKMEQVLVPHSKVKEKISEILLHEGYISSFEVVTELEKKQIIISLKYHGEASERVINGIKRVSKPGLRVYAKVDEMPKVLGGLGIAIISTSVGIFTDKVCRQKKIGGEVLAFVW